VCRFGNLPVKVEVGGGEDDNEVKINWRERGVAG